MSWLVCILDLESWLAFVWPIILVSVMHGLVWTFVDWGYMFLLHYHWAYPKVSYMVTFCVLCWSLYYTGAYPHLWVHQIFCIFFNYSIYLLILMSRHIEAYALSGFFISPIDYMVIRPICWYFQVFYWGIPPFHWVHYLSHFFRVLLGVSSCRSHSLFLIFALSVFDYRLHTSLFSWSLFSASLFGKFI